MINYSDNVIDNWDDFEEDERNSDESHTIELKWESFYELMEDIDMDEKYQEFEDRLVKMFEREFGHKFEIEWTD